MAKASDVYAGVTDQIVRALEDGADGAHDERPRSETSVHLRNKRKKRNKGASTPGLRKRTQLSHRIPIHPAPRRQERA